MILGSITKLILRMHILHMGILIVQIVINVLRTTIHVQCYVIKLTANNRLYRKKSIIAY